MAKMDLKGKKVLVVGLARQVGHGEVSQERRGSIVSTTEMRSREEMKEAVRELEGMESSVEWGGHGKRPF